MFRVLQGKKTNFLRYFYFCFLVNNSGGVFLLSVSGNATLFFAAVQTKCRFASFIKFN